MKLDPTPAKEHMWKWNMHEIKREPEPNPVSRLRDAMLNTPKLPRGKSLLRHIFDLLKRP